MGELESIANEVDEDLADFPLIGMDDLRAVRGGDDVQCQTTCLGFISKYQQHVLQHFLQIKVCRSQLNGAIIAADQLQKVVDERQQVVATSGDGPQPPVVSRFLILQLYDLRIAENGIEGGADLVRHVGEKHALGLCCRLRLIAGNHQLLLELPGRPVRLYPGIEMHVKLSQHPHQGDLLLLPHPLLLDGVEADKANAGGVLHERQSGERAGAPSLQHRPLLAPGWHCSHAGNGEDLALRVGC